jgi:hypothetical protein
MKDLEQQSQRRVEAEQATLQVETERLKQVSGKAVLARVPCGSIAAL